MTHGPEPMPEDKDEDGYYCVVCARLLLAVNGVIVHDDIPHPPDMTFDEEDNPQ